ncbi:nucleotide-diphospho-sugar transferase [Pedobacter faecalis]|uniref:nucleotide-diphospho-sugar transferase n=1 Tax=Pedobacter faecalis TaxID=3041495 RepID=UPI002550F944|nr:nucleotide-diphospho-sugar transferase [Pedobacter sp. ELA7]
MTKAYQVKSPILFLVFNRPEVTKLVFDEIRKAQPSRLYIAADGPRGNRPDETDLCKKVLEIVDQITWPCTVQRLVRMENLGCRDAVSGAIDWFFSNEPEGIILEDDCLPEPDFFRYCDYMLEHFRDDTRFRHVAGCNLQLGKIWNTASVYYSNQTNVWGWASWARVWKDYDKYLSRYEASEVEDQFAKIFSDHFAVEFWVQIFKDLKSGKIDTWDYQLTIINFFNNGLSVIPNVSLIKNIGFGKGATHTLDEANAYSQIETGTLGQITLPKYVLPQKDADFAVTFRELNLKEKWRVYNKPKNRIRRFLKL